MHIHIGHCGTPRVVWPLDTFYYYYTTALLWYGQEKLEEMMQEHCTLSQTVSMHKGTHAHDGWEACLHLGRDSDGNTAACGLLSQHGKGRKVRRGHVDRPVM